jgi:hypothetical protein
MSGPTPWHAPLIRAFRAATFFAAHACLAVIIIGLVTLVKAAVQWMGDPKLFDWIPLSYIFDAMDVATLCVFLVFAVIEAVRVFRE